MELAELIDGWITDSGLKLEALSTKTGISRQTLYKWRTDGAVPTASRLDDLATALGKSAKEKRDALALLIEKQRSGTTSPAS